ncbi:MAG: nuclear transport factor 2 family protein [Pseudomonadota bacterium]
MNQSFRKSLAGLAFVAMTTSAALADNHQDLGDYVVEALTNTLMAGDADRVTDYFSPDYINHNPSVSDGPEPLRGLASKLQPVGGLQGEIVRVIVDGDTVALHSRWDNAGPNPLIGFDVFRVADGMIVEHWDNLTPVTGFNPSGRSQIDGHTEVTDFDKTEDNRALVVELITKGFINGDDISYADYINPNKYFQHNSSIADGLDGLGAALQSGLSMQYTTIHRTVAEGNFVLTMSEGSLNDAPKAFYDLFRLEDGLIVEHWDVIADMPDPDADTNKSGKF